MSHLCGTPILKNPLYNATTIHNVEFFMPSPKTRLKDPGNVSFNEIYDE